MVEKKKRAKKKVRGTDVRIAKKVAKSKVFKKKKGTSGTGPRLDFDWEKGTSGTGPRFGKKKGTSGTGPRLT